MKSINQRLNNSNARAEGNPLDPDSRAGREEERRDEHGPTAREVRRSLTAAYNLGRNQGYQAVQHCEVGDDETLTEAAFRAEENARQYQGHIPQWIRQDRGFFDSYEDGVAFAIRDATGENSLDRK